MARFDGKTILITGASSGIGLETARYLAGKGARIVAVADVYDALTRDRVYKTAISVEEAERTILQSAGTHFDPVVVEAFRHAKVKFRAIARRTQTKNKPEGEQAVLASG